MLEASKSIAAIFFILAIVFTVFGVIVLYSEPSVVGGDAYNYIIGAGRGTGLICVGIVSALLSNACLLFAVLIGKKSN